MDPLERIDIRVTVVAREHFLHEFEALPNTDVVTDVAEAQLRALYRTSSVLLLPLTGAVANNTILESIACGLPVVTNDVGSVREYLTAEAAAMVPPGDPEALIDATERFIDDPVRRSAAARAARDLAVARFELRSVAARIHAVLDEVAAAPKTGGAGKRVPVISS